MSATRICLRGTFKTPLRTCILTRPLCPVLADTWCDSLLRDMGTPGSEAAPAATP